MTTSVMQRWSLRALNALVLSVVMAVAAYAILAYALLPPGALASPAMREVYARHRLLVYGHVFGAALALALGPWQFSARLRATRASLHRCIGRCYLIFGVGLGGLCGLALSRCAQGGPVAQLGFASLAIAWLYTGARGWLAIRARRVAQHRRWMVRNYALTLAAVSLRIYVGVVLAARWPFDPAYAAIAWLCWVPNLLLAERCLRRHVVAPVR
jgi:uncharacterized membrane protein